MAILQSIDYNKFERFSNVADEISTKLLSRFLECEVLVVVPDFEFSMEATERKHRREDSTPMQEIEVIDNQKFPKSFQCYLGNSNNKTNLVKYLFQKWRGTLLNVLTFSQTIYLANLDGATDRVTSQSSERIGFIMTTKKLTRKCLRISNSFMIIFVGTESSLFRQTVIFQ